jgi:hypothetical protein
MARRRNGATAPPEIAWMDSPNKTAKLAYRCGLLAMVPLAGLALGPIALGLGILGRLRERPNPTVQGAAQSMAAIVLGALTALTNWLGLWLILTGLRS